MLLIAAPLPVLLEPSSRFTIFQLFLPFRLHLNLRLHHHLSSSSLSTIYIIIIVFVFVSDFVFLLRFLSILSYKYPCMLLRRVEETNRLRLQDLHFLISSIPNSFQPTAVMEALEGGSSSASTKRNRMKRDENRGSIYSQRASSLFPLFSPLSLYFFIYSRKECNSAHMCFFI